MRKYIVLFFSGLLFLLACSKTPSGILQPDVMADVLTEVHIADGSLINIPQVADSVYKYGMGRYMQIFKNYGTDSTQFRVSYKYYTFHPDELIKIYDVVLKRLAAKNDSITALIRKNNTAQMKSSPALSTGKKFVPGSAMPPNSTAPHPVQSTMPMRPPLPSKFGATRAGVSLKKQMLKKLHMHKDSMLKKKLKNQHAVPLQ